MAMRCHACEVDVDPQQAFCNHCGVSLRGVTDPTEPNAELGGAVDPADADTVEHGARTQGFSEDASAADASGAGDELL